MAIRKHVVVHGRVQGVSFRYELRRRSEAHGVHGWVRNTPGGTVEAVFEGEPDAVDQLVRFCRSGPSGANVDHVDVVDEPAEGLVGFRVTG